MVSMIYSISRFLAFVIAAAIAISGMLAETDPLTVGIRACVAFFSLTILGAICARIMHSALTQAEEEEAKEKERKEKEEEEEAEKVGGLVDVVLPETDGDEMIPSTAAGTPETAAAA